MIRTLLIFVVLILGTLSAIDKDLMTSVPGYSADFKQRVWSGYLNTSSSTRRLHYVFIQSSNNNGTNTPVTLWLNGGPGCSSLLGFLQEIGPFYLEDGLNYTKGDALTPNPYSWHKLSHLLFLQSPAGVGYSVNTDPKFQYTDISTSADSFDSLRNFFAAFPEYSDNPFWVAGESYAGKYIPDLAVLIDFYNSVSAGKKINMKGVMIGNGIISFLNGQLEKSSIEFMIDHEFIDIDLVPYYRGSCFIDPESAGCRYFNSRFNQNVDQINPYNVYGYCFYDSYVPSKDQLGAKKNVQGQASILKNIIRNKGKYDQSSAGGFNGAPCAYFDGLSSYFNTHVKQYHGDDGMKWNGPCAEDITGKYYINVEGSVREMRYLLNKLGDYKIILYNGDWDDVVPYTDTIKNLQSFSLKGADTKIPFFANDQHAGWLQDFNGVLFAIVKGASHQVPQSKRAQAYELFRYGLSTAKANTIFTA